MPVTEGLCSATTPLRQPKECNHLMLAWLYPPSMQTKNVSTSTHLRMIKIFLDISSCDIIIANIFVCFKKYFYSCYFLSPWAADEQ